MIIYSNLCVHIYINTHKCICIHTLLNSNVKQYGTGVDFWVTRAMSLWPEKNANITKSSNKKKTD